MTRLLSIFQSVLAAMFGVQSSHKHAKDFSEKYYCLGFIVISILFVFSLVILLLFAVNVVIT